MELFVKRYSELTKDDLYEIIKSRISVFIVEQKCKYLDLDDKDKKSYHIYIKNDGMLKAYLRLIEPGVHFEEASIGRVLTTERGKGYANIILKKAIDISKNKLKSNIRLNSQSYVKNMYKKLGFEQVSEEFLEAGIPHVQMLLKIH